MDVPLIVALVTFLGVMLASSAVFLYFNSREALQTWRRRVDGASAKLESEAAPAGMADQLKAQLQALLEWFARMNKPSNVEEVRTTRRQLINAGYRSGKAPVFYMGAKLLLATVIVCLLAMIPAKLLGFPSVSTHTFYYVLAAACGYYIPALWLRKAIANRKDALQRAIPDALDLMVVCVEAGLGLDQAIGRVGEEVKRAHPELSDELNILALELRTGVSRQ
jgi:tight adherence protein C